MDAKTRQALQLDDVLSAVADFCVSSIGQEAVRTLEPATDAGEIRDRLLPVEECLKLFERSGSVPLGGISDLSDILERAEPEGTVIPPSDWPPIIRHLTVVEALLSFAGGHRADMPEFSARCLSLHALPELLERIGQVFDQNHEIRDNATPELAAARAELRRAERQIMRTVSQALARLGSDQVLQDDFSTIRNGRHVVPVRAGSRGRVRGIVHGASASGETVYVEPFEVVEASNELELAREREAQEVLRILEALTWALRPHLPVLWEDLGTLAAIDALHALARNANARGWKLPQWGLNLPLRLYEAHHPVLHLTRPESSVPITAVLDRGDRILLLSGPNAGGKTTAMKTLALNAALLQCGSPVPVWQDSHLPVFTGIFADIGDGQDLDEGLSTFSGHIRRLCEILDSVDDGALVLFDELGTGTDPAEGGALAVALLEELSSRAALTLATSHLGPVKLWADETAGARNASFSLDPTTHRPTYRLRLDLPGASEAFFIAANEGLPQRILERARGLAGEDALRMAAMLRRIEETERELAARLRDNAARGKALEEQEALARRRAEELREEQRRARRQLAEERQRILRETREKLERAIAELPSEEEIARRREALANARKTVVEEQRTVGSELERLKRELLKPAAPSAIAPGRKVYMQALGAWGVVEAVEGSRARLKSGTLTVTLPVDTLLDEDPSVKRRQEQQQARPAGEKDERAEKGRRSKRVKAALELASTSEDLPVTGRFAPVRKQIKVAGRSGEVSTAQSAATFTPSESVSADLDLHGFRVEEALAALDKYLDRALLAGYPYVRIVHGTGAGRLYRAVHEFLRTWPGKHKYRFGTPDEGGGGVTIVEF
jgi:DNA mismatch repair protein MutS2